MARDHVKDQVQGLDQDVDDYRVKNFAFFELLARLRSLQVTLLQLEAIYYIKTFYQT